MPDTFTVQGLAAFLRALVTVQGGAGVGRGAGGRRGIGHGDYRGWRAVSKWFELVVIGGWAIGGGHKQTDFRCGRPQRRLVEVCH